MSQIYIAIMYRITEFLFMTVGYESSLKFSNLILNTISTKYKKLDSNNKHYVVSNINKSMVMAYIAFVFINIFRNNPQYILNNSSHVPEHSQITWQRLTSLYAATDFVSLLKSSKMPFSTKLHHYGVIVALIIVLLSKFKGTSLSKALVIYGAFSAMAGSVNVYLGLRKLINPDSKIIYLIKKSALVSYILACSGNWSWQLRYLQIYFKGIPNYITIFKFLINTGLLYSWVQDDLKLMRHLITN